MRFLAAFLVFCRLHRRGARASDAPDSSPAAHCCHPSTVQGVRINVIGVGSDGAADWLRDNAVTPGGFVMQIDAWEGFAIAIRRKVSLEVAVR